MQDRAGGSGKWVDIKAQGWDWGHKKLVQPPPQFGEEIPTIRQNNSAGLFFSEMLPSHQDYGPGPPNTLSLWLLCCQRHVETLIS